jgi:hypothetical protein
MAGTSNTHYTPWFCRAHHPRRVKRRYARVIAASIAAGLLV